jgi:uncharacterized membrane protein SirB2
VLFPLLKLLHVSCALLSIGGFTLRGYWFFTHNHRFAMRSTRVLPHVVDSLLLASAIGMLLIWGMNPLASAWLSAKIVALLAYIVLGMIAFRFGRSRGQRLLAFSMALLAAGYIVAVAVTHSPVIVPGL